LDYNRQFGGGKRKTQNKCTAPAGRPEDDRLKELTNWVVLSNHLLHTGKIIKLSQKTGESKRGLISKGKRASTKKKCLL